VNRAALLPLSRDDLIALILAQHAQIETQARQISSLTARITELEAKLAAPDKTPGNSSIPPSKGQKSNLPDRPKKPRGGRPGVARALAEHPDRIIEATLAACPHCAHALGAADLPEIHAYDHIDLPPLRPIVTRINRHRGVCPCCEKRVAAPAPEGFDPGSPFGPGLSALIIHLHVTQAISFQRLVRLMAEVFGVTISQGAIANILARAQAPLVGAAQPLAQAVRTSPVVGSDETSARVGGKTPAFAGACLVAVGAAVLHGDLPHHRRHAGSSGGGDRVHGRCAAGGLGGRPLCGATWSRRGPANVPGASVTRRKLCHRGRLQRLRAGVQMAAAAGDLHRPPPPRPQG